MTTATALAINIPLALAFFALWTGIPLWLIFKHPDPNPARGRAVPAYLRARHAQHSQQPRPAVVAQASWRVDRLRTPVSSR
jgi:hypothetical protein